MSRDIDFHARDKKAKARIQADMQEGTPAAFEQRATDETGAEDGAGMHGPHTDDGSFIRDDRRIHDGRGEKPRERNAGYHHQFSGDAEAPAAASKPEQETPADSGAKPSKLNFTADELPQEKAPPKLTDKRGSKPRPQTEQGSGAKKPKQRPPAAFTETSAQAKKRLRFESEPAASKSGTPIPSAAKSGKALRPVKTARDTAAGALHRKISQAEGENAGVEAAHRTELAAEGTVRGALRMKRVMQKVSRRRKPAQLRAAAKAKKAGRTKAAAAKAYQKKRTARKYASAARSGQRTGAAIRKAALTAEKAAVRTLAAVSRHPAVLAVLGILLILVISVTSAFSSCSNMAIGGAGTVFASSYLANDTDIDAAELIYTEWETDLLLEAGNAESSHPGYDEYRYSVADSAHNPFELMGYLTAVYQDFTGPEAVSALRQIFAEQYSLTFTPETEIRYRTQTRTDPVTGEDYTAEVPYEWHILNVKLSAKSFTDVIAPHMDGQQRQIYAVLMQSKGNRQYVSNVFGFNWLPYVSSYYGYRIHPISGAKNYHKGVDIAAAQGTEIRAGHDGTVQTAGNSGGYGLVAILEGTTPDGSVLTTKYAHCSQLLVTAGQSVKKGDVIAKVGSTGDSTGPHLHLEVLIGGHYLNPLYFADTGDKGAGNALPGSPGGPDIPPYPGEPMTDAGFAALMAEAQKHLGKPYVFGASGPGSFDCSGFVCYVLNKSGTANVGRTTAQGLFNMSTPVSKNNAKPGDLIFFHSTYSSGTTVTHIGIYIGNGQMIHAGDPVQYADITSSYWQQHFYAFGRIG